MYIKEVDFAETEKKYKVEEYPLNVAIEVSTFCNLKCIMCSNKSLKRKKGRMELPLYKKIIDDVADNSPETRIWLDFYGEPLLARYSLFYMIWYAKKKGLKNINLNTNGTLLSLEMIDMLIDSEIDFISIDMDAYSKELFEKIRVGADRDAVYDNIRNFIKRKEERGAAKPILEVKIIEMEENKKEIDKIINYWSDYKIRINVRKRSTWGGNVDNPDVRKPTERYACGFAVGQFVIAWDGRVAVCGWDCEVEEVQGDMNNQTIKEIWKHKKENVIAFHMEHQFEKLPMICQKCTDWKCVGGELRIDENGKPYNRNYDREKSMLTKS